MISLFVTLVVLGLIIYCITTFIPMAPNFARLIQLVAIIIAVLIVAQYFGVGMYMPSGREH